MKNFGNSKVINYLITGASGFIGRNISIYLAEKKNNITTISRNNCFFPQNLNINEIRDDYNNFEKLKKIINKIDVIIHCAANAKFGNGNNYYYENFVKTKKLIDFITIHNPKLKFIFMSTIGVIDRHVNDLCLKPLTENSKLFPQSDYGKSKLICENYLKKKNINSIIIRPSMVIGKSMRRDSHFSYFANKYHQRSIFSKINWTGQLSVIDIQDLCSAVYFLSKYNANTKCETFICSGEKKRILEFKKIKKKNSSNFFSNIFRFAIKYLFLRIFSLKILVLPALVASDSKLRNLGWKAKQKVDDTLTEIFEREKYFKNPLLSQPSGYTVITGAASGLGEAFFDKLKNVRKNFLLIDINLQKLKKLKKQNKKMNISCVQVDLGIKKDLDEFFNSNLWRNLEISEIFLCAGAGEKKNILDFKNKKNEYYFELNLVSQTKLLEETYKKIYSTGFGSMVIVSSSAGFQSLPGMASYSSSKMALTSYGHSFSIENKNSLINILTICPGGIKTNFQKSANFLVKKNEKLLNPNFVVNRTLNKLGKRNILIISLRARLMNLISKLIPKSLLIKIYYKEILKR